MGVQEAGFEISDDMITSSDSLCNTNEDVCNGWRNLGMSMSTINAKTWDSGYAYKACNDVLSKFSSMCHDTLEND